MRQIELNVYPNDEFLHIDWHTSGGLANGSGASRGSYYGVSAVPNVFFDGRDNVLGAGDSTVAYNQYLTRINNHLADPAHSQLLMDAQVVFGGGTGEITVNVEVAPGETISSPANVRIRAAVYENDIQLCCEPVTGNDRWNYIGRALIFQEVLTISNAGQQQQVVRSFPVNAGWDIRNLEAVAWVQRDTDRTVLQSTKAAQPYRMEVVALDPFVASTSGTPAEYDVEITYTGYLADDVTVTLDESALPAGWDSEVQWGAVTDPTSITIPGMTQGQVEVVTVRTIPDATAGVGTVTATTALVSQPALMTAFDFSLFSNTPAILYVDDDRGENWGPIFENAISGAGYAYLSREVVVDGDPTAADLAGYDAVIWGTGSANFDTILDDEQQALKTYLNAGGALFVSSQGILAHVGINDFTQNYLGVATRTTFVGASSAVGVAGDPIGDGLAFPLTPPFFDLADVMTPGLGTTWLVAPTGNIGMRYASANFRTVLMSAAFEGVPAGSRNLVMERILDWLTNAGVSDVRPGAEAPELSLALGQNAPNPFEGTTRLSFVVPREGPVRLTVYDVTGRRVADLVNRVLGAGRHSVAWDGRDADGRRVASGVYLYRIQAAGESLSKEMVLRR